ncbi:DUF4186 domain-containing protein [Microvirga rosea]|uniref:DUF4186 domain-containing protein n=1 Tax=Microvirga rosea TaxID=2715425 RepID=UPI001D0B7623|nr:DUF4186 domain-containing protein [Microvirga rosea]MCB8820743.1 DUF4186 domain-containing protein [Microvirga rosea]
MRKIEEIFEKLEKSPFRQRFHLGSKERAYLDARGLERVMEHAGDFVDQRLAPAQPARDGKQTPFRGHPVFIAQHATGTCCRSCLEKWHGISRGYPLTQDQRTHILAVLEQWLRREIS